MADDMDALPELDPGVESLLRAYKAETARSSAQVDAALDQVSLQIGGAATATATATGLTGTAKVAIAAMVIGVVGVVALALSRPDASGEPTAAVARHDGSADRSANGSADDNDAAAATRDEGDAAAAEPDAVGERPDSAGTRDDAAPDGTPTDAHGVRGPAHDDTTPDESPRESAVKGPLHEKPSTTSKPRDPEPDTLAEELALLQRARTALRAGQASDALDQIAEHRRRFPASSVAEERDATEIAALCAAGRSDDARAKATAFERRHPSDNRDLLAGCDD